MTLKGIDGTGTTTNFRPEWVIVTYNDSFRTKIGKLTICKLNSEKFQMSQFQALIVIFRGNHKNVNWDKKTRIFKNSP